MTLADGAVVDASVARAYYRAALGADVTVIEAPPSGLKMLAGDAHATRPQPVAHGPEIGGPMFLAHCFEHLDGNDAVVAAPNVTVVDQLEIQQMR